MSEDINVPKGPPGLPDTERTPLPEQLRMPEGLSAVVFPDLGERDKNGVLSITAQGWYFLSFYSCFGRWKDLVISVLHLFRRQNFSQVV